MSLLCATGHVTNDAQRKHLGTLKGLREGTPVLADQHAASIRVRLREPRRAVCHIRRSPQQLHIMLCHAWALRMMALLLINIAGHLKTS